MRFLRGKTVYSNGAQTVSAATDRAGRAVVSLSAMYEGDEFAAVCQTERGSPLWKAAREPQRVTVYVEAVLEEVMLTGGTNYPMARDCRLILRQ